MRFKALLISALAFGGLVVGMSAPAQASTHHGHHSYTCVTPVRTAKSFATGINLSYGERQYGSKRAANFTGQVVLTQAHCKTDFSVGSQVQLYRSGVLVMTSSVGPKGTFHLTDLSIKPYPNGVWTVRFSGRSSIGVANLRPSTTPGITRAMLDLTHTQP